MHELKARVRAGLRLHQLSKDLQNQKQLLEDELAEAAEYVSTILPEPLQHPSLNINACFIPSRQLGGDSFDYFWLDERHLVFYLLDVSGHGLRASLPSLAVINLLRSRGLSNVDYYQPNAVLKGLNQAFQMSDRNDKYFTIWYGVYDRYSRSLTYSSAGHPPAILLTPTSQLLEQRLKTPGVPIGMFPNIKYINASCQVAANSSLYIFSDGIYEVEPQADTNAHWGLERLINLLKKYQKNPERDLKRLLEYVRTWHPNFQFEDDLSILQIDFS
jgi:sigma-B regulation protein RsbU (phosphoserine phosphatase)